MKYVKLKPNSKVPATLHGHHDATDIKPEGNYGIVLDGEYVAIDFDSDHPERRAIEDSLPFTWKQRTARQDAKGIHYLYRLPIGYKGTNTTIKASDSTKIADVKFNGYIVGPGSSIDGRLYTHLEGQNPREIQIATLDRLLGPVKALKKDSKNPDEFDVMPDGIRDNSLHKIGSALRGVGYSENGIRESLAALLGSGLIEQPEGREIEAIDLKRLAHSCIKYDTEIEHPFTVKLWRTANDLPDEQPILEWILYGFIPQHKLTFQYGTGGIGKSTWVPHLVGILLKKGLRIGFSATEETFEHFSNGVRLGMDNFDKSLFNNLFDIDNDWRFPKDEQRLREALEQNHLDFIYFDSIYDIFDSAMKGSSLAEKARPILSPLSVIAQEMKVTILGTFHENKSGDFNGPKDMENIPRALLHATSSKNRLKLHVKKSNYRKPNYDLLAIGEWIPETNPNGTPVLERNKEGEIVQNEIYVVRGLEEVEIGDDEEIEEPIVKETISLYELETNSSNDEAYLRVYKCKEENPSWGWMKISDTLGLSQSVVKTRLAKISKEN
jgi:hypothetical protein